jgi:hypothetical protein
MELGCYLTRRHCVSLGMKETTAKKLRTIAKSKGNHAKTTRKTEEEIQNWTAPPRRPCAHGPSRPHAHGPPRKLLEMSAHTPCPRAPGPRVQEPRRCSSPCARACTVPTGPPCARASLTPCARTSQRGGCLVPVLPLTSSLTSLLLYIPWIDHLLGLANCIEIF